MELQNSTTFINLQDLSEREAYSKAQRRLFAMALAHKRDKLDPKYVNSDILKLSKLDTAVLEEKAKTKQKKRRKDGTVGKRDSIPHYMKDGKGYKTKPKK